MEYGSALQEGFMALRSVFLVLLLALSSALSYAATHYYSPLSKNNVTAPECVQDVTIVNPLIAQFHASRV
jgi:hypothetical protein